MDTCPILLIEGGVIGSSFQAQADIGFKHTLYVKLVLEFKVAYEAGQHGCVKHRGIAWTGVLRSQLMELTHKMWTTGCGVFH